MTYWLITTTIGHFQFNDQMGAPIHFLSGLLRHCDFISMAPIEAEDPTPAPTEIQAIERVDVNLPQRHPDAQADRKVREVNTGRSVGSPDHCGHCGAQGHRRSRLKKCMAWNCQGHCVQCLHADACQH